MDLLERDVILTHIHTQLRQAAAGQGSLLLIGGEAGAGKTALLRRFAKDARHSAIVLIGHSEALSTPRPLGPLFDIAEAEPALGRLLHDAAPREQLFRTLLTRLAGGARPTVLAIEDAHWADEATLDLLRFLGRRVESTRALVLVTYRDDEVGPRHPFRLVLGDLAAAPAVHRIAVPPLTATGVATLAAGSGLDVAELHARTGGNPFFVTSVIAAGGAVPETVRDAILARAGRLSASAWSVLEAAAVIGAMVDPDLLQAIAGASPDDLAACLASGILDDHGDVFAFRHELAREAISSASSPARRKALHAQVLHRLEATLSGPLHPARLAHHAEAANDRVSVLRHAPEAARRAVHFHSHREAAAQYRRALRFADELPAVERAHLLEALARETYFTAQIDEGLAARTAALAIWRERGDVRKEGENRCRLADLLWAQARIAAAELEAESAVALLEQIEPGAELALAYGTLARLRGTVLRDDSAIRLGEQAAHLAKSAGALATHLDAIITIGEVRLARGDSTSTHEQLEHHLHQCVEAGYDELAARTYISLGHGFAESGRPDRAIHAFARGIEYCADRDLDLPLQHMMALSALVHVGLGDWEQTSTLADAVLRMETVPPGTRFFALLAAGRMQTRLGEPGAAALLDDALAIALESASIVFLGPTRAARAEAAWLTGDPDRAVLEARAAYGILRGCSTHWSLPELSYWRWLGGDLKHPPPHATGPFAMQMRGEWAAAAAVWDERGYHYDAACARLASDEERAIRHALDTFEALGCHPAASLARARLRQLGVRHVPRGPRPATRANSAGLTTRENEVLVLLSEGWSNREIASRLFLSPRTVERHVSSVLAKLDAVSRGDAVSAAARLGLISQTE